MHAVFSENTQPLQLELIVFFPILSILWSSSFKTKNRLHLPFKLTSSYKAKRRMGTTKQKILLENEANQTALV